MIQLVWPRKAQTTSTQKKVDLDFLFILCVLKCSFSILIVIVYNPELCEMCGFIENLYLHWFNSTVEGAQLDCDAP